MKLGTQIGLGPDHIVLDGDPGPPPQRGTAPQFSAYICCGQMQGTKHVFHVNLVQIHSVIPKLFDTKTKKSQTALKTTLRSSLLVVITNAW